MSLKEIMSQRNDIQYKNDMFSLLQVSLFTDCTPETTAEMVVIMQVVKTLSQRLSQPNLILFCCRSPLQIVSYLKIF
jgi:hypothetical protein